MMCSVLLLLEVGQLADTPFGSIRSDGPWFGLQPEPREPNNTP